MILIEWIFRVRNFKRDLNVDFKKNILSHVRSWENETKSLARLHPSRVEDGCNISKDKRPACSCTQQDGAGWLDLPERSMFLHV